MKEIVMFKTRKGGENHVWYWKHYKQTCAALYVAKRYSLLYSEREELT